MSLSTEYLVWVIKTSPKSVRKPYWKYYTMIRLCDCKWSLILYFPLSILFCSAVKACAPCYGVLCTLQVWLGPGQTKMTLVNDWLPGWMAVLICSMQATGWQQHMCWWQLHTGQALHKTIPPTVHLSLNRMSKRSGPSLTQTMIFSVYICYKLGHF